MSVGVGVFIAAGVSGMAVGLAGSMVAVDTAVAVYAGKAVFVGGMGVADISDGRCIAASAGSALTTASADRSEAGGCISFRALLQAAHKNSTAVRKEF